MDPAPRPAPRRLGGIGKLIAAAALLALAVLLIDVLLLLFAGVLLALALEASGRPLERWARLPPRVALVVVVLFTGAALVLFFWLAGPGIGEQLVALRDTLPRAQRALMEWLSQRTLGRLLLEFWASISLGPDQLGQIANWATRMLGFTVNAAGAALLAVVLGLYLAASPRIYVDGFVRLLPAERQAAATATLAAVGERLRRWMLGQALSMLVVGGLTALGLSLVGMPLAGTLGLIAGLLEFVPYFGPIVSVGLVAAVAVAQSEALVVKGLLVCLAVQQCEAYVVQPMAQRWAVSLPPVLVLLSVLVFGLLFGLPGVLLAVPLMVLSTTLVDRLYLRREASSPGVAPRSE